MQFQALLYHFYAKRRVKLADCRIFAVSLHTNCKERKDYEVIRRISALRREHREGQGL